MFKSFVNRRTISENKLKNEEQLGLLFYKLQSELKGTSIVTLVGHSSGLMRHYTLFKEYFRRIYIFERCPKLASKLERAVKRLKLKKVTVLQGDFFEGVQKLHSLGV